MLALQRHAGNQAVMRQFAAPNRRSIQRALTGLKEVKPTSTYTDEALAYWRDPAKRAQGLKEYAEHLTQRANSALKQLGCPEMTPVFDTSSPFRAAFDFGDWHLIINLNMWSAKAGASNLADLSIEEAAAAAGTIYHEARHAEQHFRIARMDAGRASKRRPPTSPPRSGRRAPTRSRSRTPRPATSSPARRPTPRCWMRRASGSR